MSRPSLPNSPGYKPSTQLCEDLSDDLVVSKTLSTSASAPLLIEPRETGADQTFLSLWISEKRQTLDAHLLKSGAMLFRGFRWDSVPDFQKIVAALATTLVEYSERSSPRSRLEDKVYTSTDYPATQKIFPHNEHSYSLTYPSKIFFGCMRTPTSGGETPLTSIRKVTARIDPEIKERFRRLGWMYVRNFGSGLGLSWQDAFQTRDRLEVEEYCRKARISVEWTSNESLRTRQVRPAFIEHPKTGESLWFNHLTFFHVSTLDTLLREVLTAEFSDEELPNNTYYGNGSPIEPAVLDQLRAAYLDETISFPWQEWDIVMLDNLLTAHARGSYTGQRKIVVSMADPITRTDLA